MTSPEQVADDLRSEAKEQRATVRKGQKSARGFLAFLAVLYALLVVVLAIALAIQLGQDTKISKDGDGNRTIRQPLGSTLSFTVPASATPAAPAAKTPEPSSTTPAPGVTTDSAAPNTAASGRSAIKAVLTAPSGGHGHRPEVSAGDVTTRRSGGTTTVTISGVARTASAGGSGTSTTGATPVVDNAEQTDKKTDKKAAADTPADDSVAFTSTASNDSLIAFIAFVLLIGAGLLAVGVRSLMPPADVPEPPKPAPAPTPDPEPTLTEDLNGAATSATLARHAADRVDDQAGDVAQLQAASAVHNAHEAAAHAHRVAERLETEKYPAAAIAALRAAADDAQEAAVPAPETVPADESPNDVSEREARDHQALVSAAQNAADDATSAAQKALRAVLDGPVPATVPAPGAAT